MRKKRMPNRRAAEERTLRAPHRYPNTTSAVPGGWLPSRGESSLRLAERHWLSFLRRMRQVSKLFPWEEVWPGPAMKLVGPLAARSPGLQLALALEIKCHGSADEILQGRLIDLVAFVDVDGAPDIPLQAGVE